MICNQSWSLTLARLCYFTTREYNFNIKGAKNSPGKGIDDKHQITVTFPFLQLGVFY